MPLFLTYLGKEGFGLFENIGALTVWLTLTNAGLTLGLINRLTECHVTGDRELARRYVSTLVLVLLGLTILFTVLVSAAVPVVDWTRIFKADAVDVQRDAAAGGVGGGDDHVVGDALLRSRSRSTPPTRNTTATTSGTAPPSSLDAHRLPARRRTRASGWSA